MIVVRLRNTDTGIGDLHGKKLMIRIQQHLDPAMLLVVLNRIFHQIGKYLGDLHLINFRGDRTYAFKGHLHIPQPGNGAETL